MAKKKTSSKRDSRKQMIPMGPKELKALAEDLEKLSRKIAEHAEDLETMGGKPLNLAMGNWRHGFGYLDGWFTNQLSKAIMIAAEKQGLNTRVVIEHTRR